MQAFEDDLTDLSGLMVTEETIQSRSGMSLTSRWRAIPACDAAGVTLFEHDQLRTAAASGPLAQRVDGHQYMANEGPCLDTLRT
jgi:hypothetical protein